MANSGSVVRMQNYCKNSIRNWSFLWSVFVFRAASPATRWWTCPWWSPCRRAAWTARNRKWQLTVRRRRRRTPLYTPSHSLPLIQQRRASLAPPRSCRPHSCPPLSCRPYSCPPRSCRPYSCPSRSCRPYGCPPLSCLPLSCRRRSCLLIVSMPALKERCHGNRIVVFGRKTVFLSAPCTYTTVYIKCVLLSPLLNYLSEMVSKVFCASYRLQFSFTFFLLHSVFVGNGSTFCQFLWVPEKNKLNYWLFSARWTIYGMALSFSTSSTLNNSM